MFLGDAAASPALTEWFQSFYILVLPIYFPLLSGTMYINCRCWGHISWFSVLFNELPIVCDQVLIGVLMFINYYVFIY